MTSKQQMKVLILMVKYLPLLLAYLYFINSVLSLFDIYFSALTFLSSCGFLPLLLIYVCCRVLKYCKHFRAYLFYIAVNNIINWLDYIYGFTEDTLISIIVVLVLLFLLITATLIKHFC